MKKIIYTLSLLLILASCSSELDIDPQNTIDASTALTNEAGVEAALIGAYNDLQDSDVFGTNYNMISELLAADGATEVEFSGTFTGFADLYDKQHTKFNGEASATWVDAYQAINTANNVIASLGVVSDDNKDAFDGQAKLIRALCYFELVRFFAKPYEAGQANSQAGIPILLNPTTDASGVERPTRSTVAEVYARIIQDLQEAQTKLSATTAASAVGLSFTRDVATALLAKVYLQQGNYAGARDQANTVITNGNYSLVSDIALAFNNSAASSEDIFALRQTDQDNVQDNVTFYASTPGVGRGDMDIQAGHLNLYEATDDRRTKLFYDGTGRKAGITRSGKWRTQFGWIPVIRLAEMYLIRAESNLRLGSTTGATPLADINTIRMRSNASARTAVSLADILMERRLELAWEGARIHDIHRTQANVGTRAYNDNFLILPIPNREILVNSNLTQNDGF